MIQDPSQGTEEKMKLTQPLPNLDLESLNTFLHALVSPRNPQKLRKMHPIILGQMFAQMRSGVNGSYSSELPLQTITLPPP